jgi:NhaP-type Na+/H+ or K+/H+ antiporter
VQSGLSQAGGLTASGSGIDIGGAMIAVTIGITVGLFMSQALVYTFRDTEERGTRKNARDLFILS